jgi:hypothetical protein
MNFNFYLDDQTGEQLNRAAKRSGQSCNALIQEAVADWLARRGQSQWPTEVLQFQGIRNLPPFESTRDKLKFPEIDPLV